MPLEGRRVLYISYNGMLDPLGQSQVLPYLRGLAKLGVRFTLLSFERAQAFVSDGPARCAALRDQLAAEGIEWHWLRYHQRPSLPATIYDVLAGISYASKLVRKNRIEMVHARAQIAAAIAWALKKRFAIKFIFDVRGLMAEEYVDAGRWQKGSLPYRLTKTMERRSFAAADAVVTLTERIWPIIKNWDGLRSRDVLHAVIPCCADLDLFKFNAEDRLQRRSELNLGERFTIVYSGSLDGWYLTEAMADFFAHVLRQQPDAHFLWLTPTRHERVGSLMRERGIGQDSYSIIAAARNEVPSYLSASDAGLAFIKPCFSKLASSPTKNAEYLACGLPIIINAGIGDSDADLACQDVAAIVADFTEEEYDKALTHIKFQRPDDQVRTRMRLVAEKLFDLDEVGVERYAHLYRDVLALNQSLVSEKS